MTFLIVYDIFITKYDTFVIIFVIKSKGFYSLILIIFIFISYNLLKYDNYDRYF